MEEGKMRSDSRSQPCGDAGPNSPRSLDAQSFGGECPACSLDISPKECGSPHCWKRYPGGEPGGCTCVNVAMGSYENQETLTPPWGGRPVGIDRCILPEIQRLWGLGVRTVASCCGHGVTHGSILVEAEFSAPMAEMGYERDPTTKWAAAFVWPQGARVRRAFPQLLRYWREDAELSLSQAAKLAGITKAHLHDLEAGRSRNPTIATLAGLARAYGADLPYLAERAAENLWEDDHGD